MNLDTISLPWSVSTWTKQVFYLFFPPLKKKIHYYKFELIFFPTYLLYFYMRIELIQIVACDNYDGFQLQIFTKIHYFKDY
jgi:hypothetical protein